MAVQIALFDDLPPCRPAEPTPHHRPKPKRSPIRKAVQLLLSFRPRYEAQDADDSDWDFPEHRVIKAKEAPKVTTTAPRSVFDLAAAGVMLRTGGRFGAAPASLASAPLYRVEREDGRTRVVRLRPDETDEWAERERIRRAKQRPPKPVKAARTKGEKLKELIGGNDGQAF